MHEIVKLIEASFRIAWDYLEAAGELDDVNIAHRQLLDSIEGQLKRGERRSMMLANKAIIAYQRLRGAENPWCPSETFSDCKHPTMAVELDVS